MRAINAQFELFDAAHVPVGSRPGERGRVGSCLVGGITRRARKYKNSGNEAKNYLKTKDITFLQCANYVRFARKLRPIRPLKKQEPPQFARRAVTRCREARLERDTLSASGGGSRTVPTHNVDPWGGADVPCFGMSSGPWFEEGAYVPTKGVGTYALPLAFDTWHDAAGRTPARHITG
jgi:hypothetical protein